jgi:sortase (surface protein transpeptidase)
MKEKKEIKEGDRVYWNVGKERLEGTVTRMTHIKDEAFAVIDDGNPAGQYRLIATHYLKKPKASLWQRLKKQRAAHES